MIKFERYRNTGEGRRLIRYNIFTREEADKYGIDYVPWRNAVPEKAQKSKIPVLDSFGVDRSVQYVLDDYGFVSPVYDGVKMVNIRSRQVQVMFIFGRRYASKQAFGYGHERMTSNFHWSEHESRRERTRRVVVAYTTILLERSRLTNDDWMKLGKLYRDDQEKPIKSVKRLFRTKAVKAMIREELASLMTKADVTPDQVMEHYETLRKDSKDAGDRPMQKAIIDKYADMLDMRPDKLEVRGAVLEERDFSSLLKPDGDDGQQHGFGLEAMPDTPDGLLAE